MRESNPTNTPLQFKSHVITRDEIEIYDLDVDALPPDYELTIPSELDGRRVARLDEHAFAWRRTLKSVVALAGVRAIGDYAFDNCAALERVVLPTSLESIGRGAFGNCPSLRKIFIPERVSRVEPTAFWNSPTTIEIDEKNPHFSVESNALFDKDKEKFLTLLGGAVPQRVVLPDTVHEIARGAFRMRQALSSVLLPEGVGKIGDYAFHFCSALTSVAIPKSVVEIGENALAYCPAKLLVYKRSYAERWALENGREHKVLDE